MGKNEQGLTLVELVVGMALLTLIMSGTYIVLASSVQSYRSNFEQNQNIQGSRAIMTEITNGLKNATATDTYNLSFDKKTKTIILQKNGNIQNLGEGHVQEFKIEEKIIGKKKAYTIRLSYGSNNSIETIETMVMTLNDIIP